MTKDCKTPVPQSIGNLLIEFWYLGKGTSLLRGFKTCVKTPKY